MEKGREGPIYLQIRPIAFLVYTDPLYPHHNHHTFPPICKLHDK